MIMPPETNENIAECIAENEPGGWYLAIRDAQLQLSQLKSKQAQLRGAIKIFKRRIADGDPFPISDRVPAKG